MEHCASTQTETFFAVCARLIGPEVKMTIEAQPVGLEPQDIAVLKAIRQAIPNADRMSAEQVLQHVLDAVRAHDPRLSSWLCRSRRIEPKKGGMTLIEGVPFHRATSLKITNASRYGARAAALKKSPPIATN